MQFYFIRHGQSENNFLYETTGSSVGRSTDPELTSVGRQQAEILARFLHRSDSALEVKPPDSQNIAGLGITHLYTSLMVRAIATGTIVAKELELPLVAWEDLHETGGVYLDDETLGKRVGQPGKNRAYFEEHYPDLILPLTLGEGGWWNRPFEEREQHPERAARVLSELIARHGSREDRVAVISHGGFYNYVLRAILKISGEGCWFGLNNVGITRIDFRSEGIDLAYMNRVDFLPRELVT